MPKQKKLDFKTHMKEHTILKGLVVYCDRKKNGEDSENEVICIDCHGTNVFIKKKDAILYQFSDALSRLVGDEVKFCIKSIENEGEKDEKIWGSMKMAKEVLIAPVMERLKSGEVVKGIVLNAVAYGAYIAVGDVTGLMKNTDFSDDGGEIRDFYQRGAEINVKYKHTSASGMIYFLPEEKRKGTSSVKVKNLSVGVVIAGKIVNAYPDRVYVNVLPGVDVLCFCPKNLGELRDNDHVQVKITRMYKDGERLIVKGKILGKRGSAINFV